MNKPCRYAGLNAVQLARAESLRIFIAGCGSFTLTNGHYALLRQKFGITRAQADKLLSVLHDAGDVHVDPGPDGAVVIYPARMEIKS